MVQENYKLEDCVCGGKAEYIVDVPYGYVRCTKKIHCGMQCKVEIADHLFSNKHRTIAAWNKFMKRIKRAIKNAADSKATKATTTK